MLTLGLLVLGMKLPHQQSPLGDLKVYPRRHPPLLKGEKTASSNIRPLPPPFLPLTEHQGADLTSANYTSCVPLGVFIFLLAVIWFWAVLTCLLWISRELHVENLSFLSRHSFHHMRMRISCKFWTRLKLIGLRGFFFFFFLPVFIYSVCKANL